MHKVLSKHFMFLAAIKHPRSRALIESTALIQEPQTYDYKGARIFWPAA